MRKIVFLVFIIFGNKAFAQKLEIPKISTGVAFRFDPWTLEGKNSRRLVYGSYYPFMETTTRFFLGIKEKVPGKNNLFVSLQNYITYARIGFKPNSLTPDKRFKRDHFIDITNEFKTKKQNLKFVLGLGAGYMNLGTKFNYIKRGVNNNGQAYIVDSNAVSSQRFFAPSLIIGTKYKNSNLSIKLYGTPDLEGEPYPTIWMEIKVGFDISLKKAN